MSESESIKAQSSEGKVEKGFHVLYSHWLTLFEQLLEVYEDHNALLSEDLRLQGRIEWLAPKLEKLFDFKAEIEGIFASATHPQPQQDPEMQKEWDLQ